MVEATCKVPHAYKVRHCQGLGKEKKILDVTGIKPDVMRGRDDNNRLIAAPCQRVCIAKLKLEFYRSTRRVTSNQNLKGDKNLGGGEVHFV
jgi:hypothetical protein